MKILKTVLAVLFMAVISSAANAGFVFGNDVFKFTGDNYIDATSATETKGIGRVSTITEGANVVWTSGDNGDFLNFVFYGFTPVLAPVAPFFNYAATGGFVDFYINSAGVFNTSVSTALATAAIQAGELFVSTTANGPTVGISTGVSYSANGFLDVVAGKFASQLDTNSRPTFAPGTFSDLSFGLVGSNNQNPLVNTNYLYITSSDLQGASQVQVSEPATVMLLGLGLVALGFYTRNRNLTTAFTAVA